MKPRRAAAIAATLGVLGLGGALVLRGVEPDPGPLLGAACEEVGAGDTLLEAFELLGRADFRPGCGTALPCETMLQLRDGPIALSCLPDDCSQQWRAGEVGCLLEVDPATRIVTAVEALRMAL